MQQKFDLRDWEGRKAALLPILQAAASGGLLANENVGRMAEFLLGRGVSCGTPLLAPQAAGQPETLDSPIASEPVSALEESEAPRFVRGFHDILITIGLVIGLSGLAGLASVYVIFPAVVVLGEILVRRQRLALPAVVLTLAFMMATALALAPFLREIPVLPVWRAAISGAATMTLTALFYWRYRVPIAFALMCIVAFATIVLIVAAGIFQIGSDDMLLDKYPTIIAFLIGLFAVLTFGTALYFDMSDRMRVTRRSDVAFWLHLAAAPAMLYTVITLVFAEIGQQWLTGDTSVRQAVVIVATVAVLMAIGLMLDRRAFVTSGLLSFGYAFKVLLTEGGLTAFFATADKIVFLILLAVGIVVLTLGIGWRPLRRAVIGVLPEALAERLPPAR